MCSSLAWLGRTEQYLRGSSCVIEIVEDDKDMSARLQPIPGGFSSHTRRCTSRSTAMPTVARCRLLLPPLPPIQGSVHQAGPIALPCRRIFQRRRTPLRGCVRVLLPSFSSAFPLWRLAYRTKRDGIRLVRIAYSPTYRAVLQSVASVLERPHFCARPPASSSSTPDPNGEDSRFDRESMCSGMQPP